MSTSFVDKMKSDSQNKLIHHCVNNLMKCCQRNATEAKSHHLKGNR